MRVPRKNYQTQYFDNMKKNVFANISSLYFSCIKKLPCKAG